VVYFAFMDSGTGHEYIRKVNVSAGSCDGIADTDYGNRGNFWNWNAQVGMSVDEATGDLYVAEKTAITKVTPGEVVSTFATGFSSILGLDVWHEPGGSFGAVLVADNFAGSVKAVPLDNPVSREVATGSVVRAVTWSRSSFSAAFWESALMNRVTNANNTSGNIALWPAPLLKAEPYEETARVWISAPDTTDRAGNYQGVVRPSFNPSSTDYSTFKVKAWWGDGVSREICAMLGDAPTTAGYEPIPTASSCGMPWNDPQTGAPNGICDNQEPFNGSAGVGTSKDSNTFKDCQSGCGSSWANACEFEFRITQRYAGDNYRVYFFQPSGKGILKSALVTAWKRAYVENDKMCRKGGLLYAAPALVPDASPGDTWVKVAKEWVELPPPDDPGKWKRRDELASDQKVHIFDTINTYEAAHDIAFVCAITDNLNDPFITVDLGTVAGPTCASNQYQLQYEYNGGVPTPQPPAQPVWDFDLPDPAPPPEHQGRCGGVCVEESGSDADFFAANPSKFSEPFDDAFTSFRVPATGNGAIPYLPQLWFDGHPPSGPTIADRRRFSQLWFQKKRAQAGNPAINDPQNYFHLVGASATESNTGSTLRDTDLSFVFVELIEARCAATNYPAPDRPTCVANFIVNTSDHEITHNYAVNQLAPCSGGHDLYNPPPNPTPPPNQYCNFAWCSGSPGCVDPALTNARCLMSGDPDDTHGSDQAANRRDEINRMECADLGVPIPPCSEEDCGEGIRNQEDPQ
jgi:hypothetical protein